MLWWGGCQGADEVGNVVFVMENMYIEIKKDLHASVEKLDICWDVRHYVDVGPISNKKYLMERLLE